MKLLSPKQKAALAQMARRAFNKQVAAGHLDGITFDQWRHDEVERLTGKPGLRECANADWNSLAAHFESLAGDDGRALNHLLRAGSDRARQYAAVIQRELQRADLPLEYAEAIALDRWKKPMADLEEEALRLLMVTIKSRLAARRRASTSTSTTNPF